MTFEGMEHHHEKKYEHLQEEAGGVSEFDEMYEPEKDVFVEVVTRKFEPEDERLKESSRAMIFIPGWLMTARDKSIEGLCKAYAKRLGCPVYAVSTEGTDCRKDGGAIDLLYLEARGIAAFVRERGLKDVIIAGHSRGGNEAIHLAAILEKDPGVRVLGLIPLNSAGLFSQDTDVAGLNLASSIPGEMTANALKGLTHPKETERQMQFASDMASNLWTTMLRFNISYPFRLKQEADEANVQNPNMKDIHSPVVLLFGKQDRVAVMRDTRERVKKLFPQAEFVQPIVVDAGHMWPIEEPAAASRRTLEPILGPRAN